MQARLDILQWKAHILRSINQEAAKQDQLKMIAKNPNYTLIGMDWAMKFLQLKYRKKRSDWYGNGGLSWHRSTVISSDTGKAGSLELQLHAHLFDTCKQDWFAVRVQSWRKPWERSRPKSHTSPRFTCARMKQAVIITTS